MLMITMKCREENLGRGMFVELVYVCYNRLLTHKVNIKRAAFLHLIITLLALVPLSGLISDVWQY